MNRRQADRSVIAARASRSARPARTPGASPSTARPGTNPAARVITRVDGTGPVRRSRAVKMTGAQRNSQGRRSEWSASPFYFTDPKWSQTVGNQR